MLTKITRALLVSTSTSIAMIGLANADLIENNGVRAFTAPDTTMANLSGTTTVDGFRKSLYTVSIKKIGAAGTTALAPYVFCRHLNSTYPNNNNEPHLHPKYYEGNWGSSHSYVNFQTNGAVEVSVTRATAFSSTTKLHPKRYLIQTNGADYVLSNSNKTLTFKLSGPGNIVVDADGLVSAKTTGSSATHPLSIHATNHITEPTTAPAGGTIQYVTAGTTISPTTSPKTYVFRKGRHDVGANFKVYNNQTFHIPGDAVVFGTFNNKKDDTFGGHHGDAKYIVFQGNGTISGTKLNHWEMDNVNEPIPSTIGGNHTVTGGYSYTQGNIVVTKTDKDTNSLRYREQQRISYKKVALDFAYCENTRMEGIVILDAANHNLRLFQPHAERGTNIVKHVKVIGFRVNTDGGGMNATSKVEDCFYRVQDDGFYPKGKTLKNNVMWSDANGACLRLDQLNEAADSFVVEDIDVIFRKNLASFSNSAAIQLPKSSNINTKNVTFNNINITDTNVTKPMINLEVGTGTISNVTLKNITIASATPKNIISTQGGGTISNITFSNVKIAGTLLTSSNFSTYFTTIGGGTLGAINFSGASVPSTWTASNVGGAFGTSENNSGTFTLQSYGNDIYNSPDAFHFVQQAKSVDTTIIAKVNSIENGMNWARAGIMMRDDLGTGANYAMICVTPSEGIRFQSRSSGTGSALSSSLGTQTSNVFLRLKKSGTTYSASFSTDNGSTYSSPVSVVIPNMSNYNVGIIASGHSGAPIKTKISNVSVTTP